MCKSLRAGDVPQTVNSLRALERPCENLAAIGQLPMLDSCSLIL